MRVKMTANDSTIKQVVKNLRRRAQAMGFELMAIDSAEPAAT